MPEQLTGDQLNDAIIEMSEAAHRAIDAINDDDLAYVLTILGAAVSLTLRRVPPSMRVQETQRFAIALVECTRLGLQQPRPNLDA
jgi:hypothetical protein